MPVLDAIGHALTLAGAMTWQVTWSLILGFTLSAVVQAVVRRETGGPMLDMMNGGPDDHAHHEHDHHEHGRPVR